MIYLIKDFSDKFFKFLQEDPVRPHIPVDKRIGNYKEIFVLPENENVQAITCVSYNDEVPSKESELFENMVDPVVAIYYTIWSYKPGAGRQLIMDSVDYIKENKPTIKRFVTLSPKTEMAKRFHLKNGAIILRENTDTINYEYLV
jgi:hypothetical protein